MGFSKALEPHGGGRLVPHREDEPEDGGCAVEPPAERARAGGSRRMNELRDFAKHHFGNGGEMAATGVKELEPRVLEPELGENRRSHAPGFPGRPVASRKRERAEAPEALEPVGAD